MPMTPDTTLVEEQIIELTNQFRAKYKRGAVKYDPVLSRAAESYARFLARSGKFSHEADGRQPADRITKAGYEFCRIGENLASAENSRGFETTKLATQTVEGWINSPGHRKNMLIDSVTDIGVGVVRAPGRYPKYISVQLFARPKSEMFTFQVSNSTEKTVTYSFGGDTHDIEPRYAFSHSSCEPDTLTFMWSGKGRARRKLSSRYEASDGKVYTLKTSENGKVIVDVTTKERVSGPSERKSSQR